LALTVAGFAAGTTREQQQATLDSLIDQWAQPSGKVGSDWLRLVSRTVRHAAMDPADYRDDLTDLVPCAVFTLPEEYCESGYQGNLPYRWLNTAGLEVMRWLGDLEAFNGSRFVDFTVTETCRRPVVAGPPAAAVVVAAEAFRNCAATRSSSRSACRPSRSESISAAYSALTESVYAGLVMQTRLHPYLDEVQLRFDDQSLGCDTSLVVAKLEVLRTADPRAAFTDLVELNRYAVQSLDGIGFDGMTLLRGWVDALPAESPLHDDLAALRVIRAGSTLLAGPSSDLYLGSSQDGVFNARAGSDLLDGGHASDLLYASKGNDVLRGGQGHDAYTSDPDHPSKSMFALTPIIFGLPLGREDRSARSNSKISAGISRCIRRR
jgi:hypothetical protein